ncbi:hypothetical protein [Paraburkholderia pallida]|nr:hypothetical protein [Paraburkholderia pallida]
MENQVGCLANERRSAWKTGRAAWRMREVLPGKLAIAQKWFLANMLESY